MIKPNGDQPPERDADSNPGLQEIVTAAVQKHVQSKSTAGLAVGVITDGESRSFFFASNANDRVAVPDGNSVFEIGSITKVFTTTVLADMHLKGEVHLDAPVNQYLPSSARLPGQHGSEMTLRHLATHTTGLPRLPANLDFKKADLKNPYAHYTVDDLYNCLAKTKLKSKPGTRSEYSNFGSGLLGHILAKAADTDYETLVKQRICEPLALMDTTITLSADQRQRLAVGHSGGKPVPNWDLPALAGAGALRSTLPDMLRFLRANVEPTSTPLERALKLAHEIQVERQYRVYRDFGCMAPLIVAGLTGLFTWQSFGLPVWARVAAVVASPVVLYCLWPMGLDTMALGWHVDDLFFDKPVLWHNGGTGGYASYMAFQRETRQGVVLLANSDKAPDAVGRKLLRCLKPTPG
ncbi:MAG: serine hydrolase domain-containing protein [Planctomycetaceae bacterium]